MKHIKHKTIYIPIIFLNLLFGCISPPDEFTAPIYDIELSVPITDTLITIKEFTEDDSTLVPSDDPDMLGVLVYSDTETIDPFYVDENLTFDAFSSVTSTAINDITIEDVPPIETFINISDWAPINDGTDTPVPEIESSTSSNFNLFDQFENATFESGTLELKIINNLPVLTELKNFKILNVSNGSIVAETDVNTVITIQPFDSTFVDFDLANKDVTNQLKVETSIYTPGSNGDTVYVPQNAGTRIIASLKNTDIVSVVAKIPEQAPFELSDSFVFDDSSFIKRVVFDEGSFGIRLDNYIDAALEIDLTVNNLFDENGNVYHKILTLDRDEKNKTINVNSLHNWEIKTSTESLTNELNYLATVVVLSTNDAVEISKGDSVTIQIDFDESTLKYAEGIIKPTSFNIAESEFTIDLGDVDDYFSFDSIFVNNPTMLLNLASSVNYDLLLNGIITGKSTNMTKDLTMQLDLPARVDEQFNLNDYGFVDFINDFLKNGEIPNSFTFKGTGIVNPYYKLGSVAQTDSVTGQYMFETPLNVGISGGTFKDTIYIEDMDIDQETIDAINSVDLVIETLNKIPLNVILSGIVVDANDQPLFPIPPSYNPDDYIQIEAPTVDDNGNVISAETRTQAITLTGEDAQTFLNNPNIILNFVLDTPPLNTVAPVKIRETDYINFKLSAKFNYRVNNE